MNKNRRLIHEYLRALSGQPKPPEVVAKYVAEEELAEHIAAVEAAFPCHELIPHQIVCEREMVVVRGEFRGVHQGLFLGIDATGRSVCAELVVIYQIRGRKIVNHWMRFDTLSLLNQLQVASGRRDCQAAVSA